MSFAVPSTRHGEAPVGDGELQRAKATQTRHGNGFKAGTFWSYAVLMILAWWFLITPFLRKVLNHRKVADKAGGSSMMDSFLRQYSLCYEISILGGEWWGDEMHEKYKGREWWYKVGMFWYFYLMADSGTTGTVQKGPQNTLSDLL